MPPVDIPTLTDEVVGAASRTNLVGLVESRLRSAGHSELEIADSSEAIVKRVQHRLRGLIAGWEAEGQTPLGRLSGAGSTIWIPIGPSGPLIEAWLGALAGLPGHEFEGFVVFALRRSGHAAKLIPREGNESGIDLYARLNPERQDGLLCSVPARVAGQVTIEHVGEDRVRKFRTDVGDFVEGRGRAAPLVEEWYWQLKLPVLPVLVAVGGFSGPALSYAHRMGCVTISGRELANSLAGLLDEAMRGLPTTARLIELSREVKR